MINVNLLPKHLKRVKEPAYWRLIAILFPLLAFGIMAGLQFSVSQTERNKSDELEQLQVQRAQLQPFVQKRQELQTELQQLQVFEGLGNQIRADQIIWTDQLSALLETLPAQGNAERPRISFQNISMQTVPAGQSSPARFEGQAISSEISISGEAASTDVISEFIATLETSPNFGVEFQSASLNEETGHYSYNLTVGALASANFASATFGGGLDESQSE